MDEAEIKRFRQKLLRLRTDLQALEESSAEAGRPVELDQSRVGRLSRMDAMQGQQMAREAARRRQHRLRMIEGALRRMDAGVYGYCTQCGEEIDSRRLEFDPATPRCIRCAD
jgi:DnaK suppressor protein